MSANRRRFLKQMSVVPLTFSLLGAGISARGESRMESRIGSPMGEAKKPQRLRPGDTIGLISPSGAIYETEPFEIAIEALQNMGLKVKTSDHLYDRYGYLGGRDEDRAREINEMFRDEEVKAIICVRGGSGAARIVDKLDYKAIRNNPKIFVGYSDITAFLLAIYAKAGLVTFHGPVATSDWTAFSLGYFRKILFDAEAPELENPGKREHELVQTTNRIRTICPGTASGVLAGGNLSVLSGMVGTGYLPDWKGKILFLEEIGENIYRIDRMMAQLKLAGVLDQLSGFVMGKCTGCDPGGGYGSLTLEEVIDYYILPLQIPAYSGAMIGHISEMFTVPVGVEAQIDAEKGIIQLTEPAVL